MGSEHNKFKKDSKYSDFFDQKNIYKDRLSEGSTRKSSNLLNNLQKEKEPNNNDIIKSKTDIRISETAKENEEKINSSKKERKVANGLKSFSSQNLVKIENGDNSENEENPSSNSLNQYNKTAFKELYGETENDISDGEEYGEEIKEIKENKENDQNETEEDEKMVPNNIKKVFIDSRPNKNTQNENKITIESSTNEDSKNINLRNTSSNIITVNDYELNFYRNGADIRQSYLSKLIVTKIWTPNIKPKKHNCLIIFDWDDTLLPTSFLTKGGIFYEDMKLSLSEQKKMVELENLVFELLNESTEKGTVYIITNAGKGWVEYSADRFYPRITPLLDKIKIISARGEYEKDYPGNSRQWKIEAFLKLQKTVDVQLVTNIICLGDSLFEMEAGRILASRFTEAFIKTIKFRETPKLDELIKQLKLVCKQFSSIYSSIKNLTIRVERKKK